MTSKLMRAMRFGILIGILFTAISLYLPKAVSQQCGAKGAKEYTVLGVGPISNAAPDDTCDAISSQDKLLSEINDTSKSINVGVGQVVNIEEVEKTFPVKTYLDKYFNMGYLESKPLLYRNFMTFATLSGLFFFIFAPSRSRRILSRF